MRRVRRLLPAAWLVALLVAPAVAWLLGDRQPLLQNEPKNPFPTLSRATLEDDETFAQLDDALLDRLPLRGQALELRAAIAYDLFDESVNTDVAVGRDGWLYLVPEIVPCVEGGVPETDPVDPADVMARTLVAAGYRTAVVIAAGKQGVHERDVPPVKEDETRCMQALERRMDARLATAPGGVALSAELRRMEARGVPTFLRTDSHWNWRGRELFARRALDTARPGLADEVGLRAGPAIDWPGNLTALMGLRRTEPDRAVIAERAPERPLPPGDVVLIGDSQTGVSLLANPLPGYPSIFDTALPGQRFCGWPELIDGLCDSAIRDARSIVFEKVARDVLSLTLFCWRPVAIAGERLRGEPGRWARPGGSPLPPGGLAIGDDGVATVAVRLPAGDASDMPRLVRIPVRRYAAPADGAPAAVSLAQLPRNGRAVACATPSQSAEDGALFLPVPAGRPASDLVMELRSAPGTRLGPPEEIVLDGRRLAERR